MPPNSTTILAYIYLKSAKEYYDYDYYYYYYYYYKQGSVLTAAVWYCTYMHCTYCHLYLWASASHNTVPTRKLLTSYLLALYKFVIAVVAAAVVVVVDKQISLP